MSTERDVTRVVRSWLNEDRHEDADRVLNTVLDELDATPQRRSTTWSARRFPPMNNIVRVGLVAAAVAIIAVIAYNLVPGSPVPGGEPSSTPEPTVTSAPSAPLVLRLDDQEPLEPGRYLAYAGPQVNVTVAVPSGWSASGDWVVIGPRGNQPPDGMAIRFYSGELNLYVNPLSVADGELYPEGVGPTVADLAQAIVAQPAWTATAPTDIEIGGHPGQLVQLTIPLDAPLTGEEAFYLFVDNGGGQIWGGAPGQTFDLYILDVDGERLVIDAYHYPDTSQEDLAAQRTVVESVQASANP